jgi:hypothetical protein
MMWSVAREGGVIHADISSLDDGTEWEALLHALDAELTGTRTSQVVIHAGEKLPAPGSFGWVPDPYRRGEGD